jgi:2-haloacid dehalogenase
VTPRALTFDLFWNLVDVEGVVGARLAALLQRTRPPADPLRVLAAWAARRSNALLIDALLEQPLTPFSEHNRRALDQVLRQHGITVGADEATALADAWYATAPFPDVVPALRRIKERYPVALLTNVDVALLERVTAPLGIAWDALISSQEAGMYKPSPRVFRHAAARLGLPTGDVLHVAAAASEIWGARAAGMQAVLVNRGGAPLDPGPFTPDLVVRDFGELADQLCDG